MSGKHRGGDKEKRERMKKLNPRGKKHGGKRTKTKRNIKGQQKFNSRVQQEENPLRFGSGR